MAEQYHVAPLRGGKVWRGYATTPQVAAELCWREQRQCRSAPEGWPGAFMVRVTRLDLHNEALEVGVWVVDARGHAAWHGHAA